MSGYRKYKPDRVRYRDQYFDSGPIITAGIMILVYCCEDHIRAQQGSALLDAQRIKETYFPKSQRHQSYDNYFRNFHELHQPKWRLNTFSITGLEGPQDKLFQNVLGLAKALNLIELPDYFRPTASDYQQQIDLVVDIALAYLAIDLQDFKPNSTAQKRIDAILYRPFLRTQFKALVLGLEDDIEIFKDDIVELFGTRADVDFFTLDKTGNKTTLSDEKFSNEPTTDEVKPDNIYFNMINAMAESTYDLYIVLIGVRYGSILNFEDFELISTVGVRSKRHLELAFSIDEAFDSNRNLYLYRPEPLSKYENKLKAERNNFFNTMAKALNQSKEELLLEENKHLSNLKIHLTAFKLRPDIFQCFDVPTVEALKENITDTLIASFDTATKFDDSRGVTIRPMAKATKKSTGTREDSVHDIYQSTEERMVNLYRHFNENSPKLHLPGTCLLIRDSAMKTLDRCRDMIAGLNLWQVEKPPNLKISEHSFRLSQLWLKLGTALDITVSGHGQPAEQIDQLAREIVSSRQKYILVIEAKKLGSIAPHQFLDQIWQPLYRSLQNQLRSAPLHGPRSELHLLTFWVLNHIDPSCCVNPKSTPISYDKFLDYPLSLN